MVIVVVCCVYHVVRELKVDFSVKRSGGPIRDGGRLGSLGLGLGLGFWGRGRDEPGPRANRVRAGLGEFELSRGLGIPN